MQELTKKQEELFLKLNTWLKKVIPNDYDKFDLRSEIDYRLNYSENKDIVREKINALFKLEDDLKSGVEKANAQQEAINAEKMKEVAKEIEEYNSKVSYEYIAGLDKFYYPIERGMKKLAAGFESIVFVQGSPGTGKTTAIKSNLKRLNVSYYEVAGQVTDAMLYRILFEHRKEVILFKEVGKLLSSNHCINLLKSATETNGPRLISKHSYSKDQDDLPSEFIFEGKLIFDYNQIPHNPNGQDFEALVSRGLYIPVVFCMDEIKQIIRIIAKEDWQKKVTEYLINNFESNGFIKLNLRTQAKCFKTYNWAVQKNLDWQKELDYELKNQSKTRLMLYELIGNRVVTSSELCKLMVKNGLVNSRRVGEYKIKDFIFLEELYCWDLMDRNYSISINPKEKVMTVEAK